MTLKKLGRLAMRIEACPADGGGDWWIAYYAPIGTMDGAVELSRIRMALLEDKPDRRSAYLEVMTTCVADMIEDLTGERPDWKEKPAPESERKEHERAGRA